jgi:hypothetical protein
MLLNVGISALGLVYTAIVAVVLFLVGAQTEQKKFY